MASKLLTTPPKLFQDSLNKLPVFSSAVRNLKSAFSIVDENAVKEDRHELPTTQKNLCNSNTLIDEHYASHKSTLVPENILGKSSLMNMHPPKTQLVLTSSLLENKENINPTEDDLILAMLTESFQNQFSSKFTEIDLTVKVGTNSTQDKENITKCAQPVSIQSTLQVSSGTDQLVKYTCIYIHMTS